MSVEVFQELVAPLPPMVCGRLGAVGSALLEGLGGALHPVALQVPTLGLGQPSFHMQPRLLAPCASAIC